MAGHVWIDYGYGFCTTGIETTKEAVEALLENAPLFKESINQYFEAAGIVPTLEDYLELDTEYGSDIAYILREVINERFGIELQQISDYNGEWFLLFSPGYPWEFKNEKEKSVTKEYLDIMFTDMVDILTDKSVHIDFQRVENFD